MRERIHRGDIIGLLRNKKISNRMKLAEEHVRAISPLYGLQKGRSAERHSVQSPRSNRREHERELMSDAKRRITAALRRKRPGKH